MRRAGQVAADSWRLRSPSSAVDWLVWLAAAIACAKRGLGGSRPRAATGSESIRPAGEGLLPPARAALDALGVLLSEIERSAYGPFLTLRYVRSESRRQKRRLPDGGGLGVRRDCVDSGPSGTERLPWAFG